MVLYGKSNGPISSNNHKSTKLVHNSFHSINGLPTRTAIGNRHMNAASQTSSVESILWGIIGEPDGEASILDT
jgi:hypothetical protein